MTNTQSYDAIIIGSGQAGNPLAQALASAGRRTAMIEREHVGGTCINEGCTPTKTMVASARVAYLARRSADYGVHTGPVQVDMAQVRARKRAIVDLFRGGGERRIANAANIDLHAGEARFIGPRTVTVAYTDGHSATLEADQIFINVGARPSAPPISGLDTVTYLDSTSIMELDTVPEHLLVLGGGYIGLEFGQMFRRFGSAVTIVQRGDQLLGREDADIAEAVAQIMREDGIDVRLNTTAVGVARAGDGVALTARDANGEQTLTGSHLLIAVGRAPNTDSLDLAAAGIEADKHGFVRVNERLETNVPGIYALGDVKGGPAFTHISYDDYRIVKANLLDGESRTTSERPVPYTVFIDPQLGRVGLSEAEARAQNRTIKVATMPMNYVARALEMDEARGMMKAIVDADSGQIVGCAILGIEGGEIMTMLQLAMAGNLPYTALRDMVFAHPTLAESLNNLFASLDS